MKSKKDSFITTKKANVPPAQLAKEKANVKISQVIHNWYTDRWNEHYHKANEPGWAISDDIAELLQGLDPKVSSKKVAKVLAKMKEEK